MTKRLPDIFGNLGKVRYAIPQLTMDQYVNMSGVGHFKNLIRGFGWVLIGDTQEADLKGIDLTYKLGYASVHIQVKSANLVIEFEKDPTRISYRRWHWDIFSKKKGLQVEFYKEKSSFLGLVGLAVHEEIYGGTHIRIMKKRVGRFVETKEPKIGLIPGSKVVEHFKTKAKKSNSITLKENSISQWDEYFNYESIKNLLLKEFQRQTKERKEI